VKGFFNRKFAKKLIAFAASSLALISLSHAQTLVHFPSLDGPPATQLDAYFFDVADSRPHAAVVFMHGCGGMFNRRTGKIVARDIDWAQRINALGIAVLMVDGFGSRQHGQMCAPSTFDGAIYRARSQDAYAALAYLQSLPQIKADRIGMIGWSQGGGALLNAIRSTSSARPAPMQHADFRAAIAFYPASCRRAMQGASWSSPVPLLLLIGEKDVWTPLQPCIELMSTPVQGTQVTVHTYPDAYHDFDWPDMRVHEVPAFTTKKGVVPIEGTNPQAREDALQRVPDFLMHWLNDH
jgi:dienelactone hydrolase